MSRCAAPATKSHPPTSPNTATATQNQCHQWSASHMKRHFQCAEQVKSPFKLSKYCACHAKLNWAVIWLNCYLTELVLYWSVTWLSCIYWIVTYWTVSLRNCYFTERLLCGTVTLRNCYFTELLLCGTVTFRNCYFTELLLDGTVTLLNCYFTELLLYGTVTLRNCYFTELLLYWIITLLNFYFSEFLAFLKFVTRKFLSKLPLIIRFHDFQYNYNCHFKWLKLLNFVVLESASSGIHHAQSFV